MHLILKLEFEGKIDVLVLWYFLSILHYSLTDISWIIKVSCNWTSPVTKWCFCSECFSAFRWPKPVNSAKVIVIFEGTRFFS